jgi:hypothetical protein
LEELQSFLGFQAGRFHGANVAGTGVSTNR